MEENKTELLVKMLKGVGIFMLIILAVAAIELLSIGIEKLWPIIPAGIILLFANLFFRRLKQGWKEMKTTTSNEETNHNFIETE